MSRLTLFALLAAVSGLAGCGANVRNAASGPVEASASALFPAETLRDWVSYADHVVVYTIIDERELAPTKEDAEHGEGMVPREVTVRVDRKLWSAPRAPALPAEIKMSVLGSVLHDNKKAPAVSRDGPRVAVGERYIAPLALVEFDVGPEWWPLSLGAQIPLEGSRVAPAAWNPGIESRLEGRSVDEVEALVKAASPDPVAASHMGLRPQDRVRAVNDARAQP